MELLFATVGLILGSALAALLLLHRQQRVRAELSGAIARADLLDEQRDEQHERITQLREECDLLDEKREHAERQLETLRQQLRAKEEQFAQQKEMLERAEERLTHTFGNVGAQALKANNEQFIALARKTFENLMTEAKGDVEKKQQAIDSIVKPIRELLEKHNTAVRELEGKRESAYVKLEAQIKSIAASHDKLDKETSRLVTALRRPEQRGRWGEMQLRRLVEMAGMTKHCDFDEQPQTDDPDTRDRPDMTINLPGGGVIVIDSKIALDAYLSAVECEDEQQRADFFDRHTRQIDAHVRKLAAKQYWNQFERTPKLVVMFVRVESALMAATDRDINLHARALENHVLIATPTLFFALLNSIAYGWQQEDVAENAREISRVGKELYDRLTTFVAHLDKVGVNLDRSTNAYNAAIGSLERSVLPSTRRLKDLHVTRQDELIAPPVSEIEPRPITAPELFPLLPAEEAGAEKEAHAARER